MQITLAHVAPRGGAGDAYESLVRNYAERCAAYARFGTEGFRTQEALFTWLDRQRGRTEPVTVFLDSRGRMLTSEAFSQWLGSRRDEGAQQVVFVIGPADGWSEAARARATMLLSLGPMTLAHSLARLVMAEQIYRALTILAGHPYHTGH